MVDGVDGLAPALLQDAGAIDNSVDAVEPRQPAFRRGVPIHVDGDGIRRGKPANERFRPPHRTDHPITGVEQVGDDLATDEPVGARYQYAGARLNERHRNRSAMSGVGTMQDAWRPNRR